MPCSWPAACTNPKLESLPTDTRGYKVVPHLDINGRRPAVPSHCLTLFPAREKSTATKSKSSNAAKTMPPNNTYDRNLPAERFKDSLIKLGPTAPEVWESRYSERNYTQQQLVDKNFKQKQKSVSSDTTAMATLNLFTSNKAERRGYKHMATSNMLKKQGVPERKLSWTDRLACIGDGLNIFSSKKK